MIHIIIDKLKLNNLTEVIVLESCTKEKISYHIHFIDMYCTNIRDMAIIIRNIKYAEGTE